MSDEGRLLTWKDVSAFIWAGNATFTLLSRKTGTRYTYRIRRKKDAALYFVSLLRGPNNEDDYAYMGVVDQAGFRATNKSRISADAPSHKTFRWFLDAVRKGERLGGPVGDALEVWHAGRCGRCRRLLTVPSSVALGIGPECASRMAA